MIGPRAPFINPDYRFRFKGAIIAIEATRDRRRKMPTIFVAKSESLQNWASDVGLTAHVYKLGVSEDRGDAAVEALNAGSHAGRSDWRLLTEQKVDAIDETAALARAARKEKLVDPVYYPQIKRAPGIFKVKLANAENFFLIREALEGQQTKRIKLDPAQIGIYLIHTVTGS
jgi:hypothetical protein